MQEYYLGVIVLGADNDFQERAFRLIKATSTSEAQYKLETHAAEWLKERSKNNKKMNKFFIRTTYVTETI